MCARLSSIHIRLQSIDISGILQTFAQFIADHFKPFKRPELSQTAWNHVTPCPASPAEITVTRIQLHMSCMLSAAGRDEGEKKNQQKGSSQEDCPSGIRTSLDFSAAAGVQGQPWEPETALTVLEVLCRDAAAGVWVLSWQEKVELSCTFFLLLFFFLNFWRRTACFNRVGSHCRDSRGHRWRSGRDRLWPGADSGDLTVRWRTGG